MEPGEPALVPQWLRTPPPPNNSGGGQQTRGDSAWLRGRGDPPPDATPKANSRPDFGGRGGFGGHGEAGPAPRRQPDRSFRSYRYSFRSGSFSARGDPFDDRDPAGGGPGGGEGYTPRHDGHGFLTRSLSEGPQVLTQGGGPGRPGGHHRAPTASELGREGHAHGGGGRPGGGRPEGGDGDPAAERGPGRHPGGQASARRRADPHSVHDKFEREFPSLSTADARSASPVDKAPAWLGQAGGGHGQWTSKLAEVPPGRHTTEAGDGGGDARPPSGSQSARMADAVQQSPADATQQTVTDKQRLEVKQSRMMIPVVPMQAKAKGGAKGTGRGRNERDRDVKLYNNLMSASLKSEDSQKDGTVVLGRRTGVLPKMTISWGEAPAALNGIVQEAHESGFGELNGHHQHSASDGRRDSAVIQERQRQHQRQQSRNSFFDLLKKKSAGGERPPPEAVKRVASAPTGRMKNLVAQSMDSSVLQAPAEDKQFEGDGEGADGLDSRTGMDSGNCLSPQDSLETVLVHSPKADDRLGERDTNSDEACPWVPPSAEEERLLREMGWQSDDGNDEDFHLTEEEIAAFRAKQYKRRLLQSSMVSAIQCTSFRMSPAKLFNSSEFLAGSHESELTTSDSGSEQMR